LALMGSHWSYLLDPLRVPSWAAFGTPSSAPPPMALFGDTSWVLFRAFLGPLWGHFLSPLGPSLWPPSFDSVFIYLFPLLTFPGSTGLFLGPLPRLSWAPLWSSLSSFLGLPFGPQPRPPSSPFPVPPGAPSQAPRGLPWRYHSLIASSFLPSFSRTLHPLLSFCVPSWALPGADWHSSRPPLPQGPCGGLFFFFLVFFFLPS
jgi:hypothetical protein